MLSKLKFYITLFIIIVSTVSVSAVNDFDVIFNSGGSQLVNITIPYSQITRIEFNITGLEYSFSYPSNITIDFANDGFSEWNYIVYHSDETAITSVINNAWSTNPNSAEIYFMSSMSDVSSGKSLARIQNNTFQKTANILNGSLGITTIDTLNQQVVSITTNTTTIHTFVPYIYSLGGETGLYIANGGSTYYCNSDHTFSLTSGCDLSISEALTPTHLARQATDTDFTLREPINNPRIAETINSKLESCSIPCDITINITSSTPGKITFSDFQIAGQGDIPDIRITEGQTQYNIAISSDYPLTNVRYFYGKMPQVFIVPVVANDDTQTLTTNQSLRLNILKNTLADSWDSLTDSNHPMNFTFFMTPITIPDYKKNDNSFSNFLLKSRNIALTQINNQDPVILVILDIKDYFPNAVPSNSRTTIDTDGVISDIYINGFSDSNPKTTFYNYDNSILKNIVLHELAHTFIFYPTKNKLFYEDHPSSFTNLSDFTTYTKSQSPNTQEGYYEIYSILNQIRPFISDADINNIPIKLSILDKMLLGILSSYDLGDYVFYSGNIIKSGNRYLATNIISSNNENAGPLYLLSSDNYWWDVRTSSSVVTIEDFYSFSIPKINQDDRALWIYAEDDGHPGYFKVFNLNSDSRTNTANFNPPSDGGSDGGSGGGGGSSDKEKNTNNGVLENSANINLDEEKKENIILNKIIGRERISYIIGVTIIIAVLVIIISILRRYSKKTSKR